MQKQNKNLFLKSWILIALFFFTASCAKKKKEMVIPDEIINSTEMAKILADIHVTEATINLRNVDSNNVASLNASLYKSVFNKHKISVEEFKKSYAFYIGNPEIFNAVYDQVITEITKMQAAEEKKK